MRKYNDKEIVGKTRLAWLLNDFILNNSIKATDVGEVTKDELVRLAAERACAWVSYLGQVAHEEKDMDVCSACQTVLSQTISILCGGDIDDINAVYSTAVKQIEQQGK